MNIDITRFSLSEARARFANLLARAALGGERFRLTRRGLDEAALVGMADITALRSLDAAEGVVARWDPVRVPSPRLAREELADKLTSVALGERVLIGKRGRDYAALVPIRDLDRLERPREPTPADVAVFAESAPAISTAQKPPGTATTIFTRADGGTPILAEIRVRADRAAGDGAPLEVRCLHRQPPCHVAVVAALRLAAETHRDRGNAAPSGFTYEITTKRATGTAGEPLSDLSLEVAGDSIQAPAFVAAALSLMDASEIDILATGSLRDDVALAGITAKVPAAVDRHVETLALPEAARGEVIAALASAGWSWDSASRTATLGSQTLRILTYAKPNDLFGEVARLCGDLGPVGSVSAKPPRQRTMGDLWRAAFGQNPDATESDFLAHIETRFESENIAPKFGQDLTPLQEQLLDLCGADLSSSFFTGDRHLIVSGGTSSGKTTVTEMLAVATALGRDEPCVLYIAPTRALAQIKHRELIARYGDFPAFKNPRRPIILATGEDSDDDWRFREGRFSIASVVYEKANVLSQVQRGLMRKTGLIVIDEAHMLDDSDRGPILEMLLLKSIATRRGLESQSETAGKRKLRIAVISTETVGNDTPLVSLLTVTPLLGEAQPPLIVAQPERPGTIRHTLILPGSNGNPYDTVEIATFENAKTRSLSTEQIALVDRRLAEREKRQASGQTGFQALAALRRNRDAESSQRLHDLLMAIVRQPAARNVLVFVPSMGAITSLASRLRNALKTRENSTVDVDQRLLEAIKSLDDENELKGLMSLAEVGIFIHHSGVDRAVRDRIAEIWGQPSGGGKTRFLFASETLSFGVNLAIDDVVMYGTAAYSGARNRNKDGQEIAYSACEYHNMVGRAGRKGLTEDNATCNVFIVAKQHPTARVIIDEYYGKTSAVRSRLFVEDDVVVEARTDPAKRMEDVSHPFVHAMLDLLRFVSTESENDAAKPVEIDLLVAELEAGSLFFKELAKAGAAVDTKRKLRKSLETVLESLAADGDEQLRLVKRVGEVGAPTFEITQKGKDLLDTGTETQTLRPLMALARSIETAWTVKHGGLSVMPAELALIAIIAQRECLRAVRSKLPEAKIAPDTPAEIANVAGVQADFEAELKTRVAGSAKVADQISNLLVDFFKSARTKSPDLWAARVMRLSLVALRWINGESRKIVKEPAQKVYPKAEPRPFSANLPNYFDRLAWKAELLMRLLAPQHEIELSRLVDRVRIGGTTNAVRLSNALPTLNRVEANKLVAMASPDAILRAPSDGPEGKAHQKELVDGLRKQADGQCAELMSLMCSQATASGFLTALGDYSFAEDTKSYGDHRSSYILEGAIRIAVSEIGNAAVADHDDPGDFEFEPALWVGADGRRLDIRADSQGFVLAETQEGVPDKETRLLVVGASEKFGAWTLDDNNAVLADVIAAHHDEDRLIVAVTPWFPLPDNWPADATAAFAARKSAGKATLIMAAPTLLVLLVLLHRRFGGPVDLLCPRLGPGSVEILTVHGLRKALIANADLPGALRRGMAKFQEVEVTIPESLTALCCKVGCPSDL